MAAKPKESTYDPNPGQIRIQDAARGDQRHTLVYGGSRSGKTFEIVHLILVRALRGAKSRHGIFRYRFNACKQAVWLDTFVKVCEVCYPGLLQRLVTKGNDGYVVLPNGSEVWFGGLDEKERTEKILGQEFCTMYFNEASQIPYSSIQLALTRLAQQVVGLRNRAYYDLNPVGTDHWTYRQFIQKVDPIYRRPLLQPHNYVWVQVNPKDNIKNIDPEYMSSLEQYDARQRRRFLEGEYQPDIEGALWTLETIDSCRLEGDDIPDLCDFRRIVIGVDPSGTSGPEDKRSDKVGIIVAGVMDAVDPETHKKSVRGVVLADRSTKQGPHVWGKIVADTFEEFQADAVVAEKNFGGDMVKFVMRTANPHINIRMVTASRGKAIRAEPISSLYAQGRIHHVERFMDLEEQYCNFSTAGWQGSRSPDSADAAIHALTDLMVRQGVKRAQAPAPKSIPIYAR